MPHSKQSDGFEHVVTDSEVCDLVDRLAQHPFVAFDTEFVSEHTYRSQLCLVQTLPNKSSQYCRSASLR